jgi:hypothetical protein
VPEITFFMIVTPRDVVIADYAVRSYAKITDFKRDFSLLVYSNYLLPEQKAYYFPRWEAFPFVTIARNDQHDAELREFARLEAATVAVSDAEWNASKSRPFEYCDPVWSRELRKIQTPFVATVDADFEILGAGFVTHMMRRLRAEPELVGISTDYSSTEVVFEPYSGNTIILNERNHTWFCIYKHTAFERSQVSHAFHREMLVGAPVERNCWDSAAYFQKSLRDQGLRFDHLHGQYRRDFIHYGAFSKNTSVTRENVGAFRLFAIVENVLPGRAAQLVRRARKVALPRLENNRYQYVREAPIRW